MSNAKESEPKQSIGDYIWNIFSALLAFAFLVVAALFGYVYLTGQGIDITDPGNIPNAIIKLSADCEGLKAELKADVLCMTSDDCSFTRDELDLYRQHVSQYNAKCDPDKPLTVGT